MPNHGSGITAPATGEELTDRIEGIPVYYALMRDDGILVLFQEGKVHAYLCDEDIVLVRNKDERCWIPASRAESPCRKAEFPDINRVDYWPDEFAVMIRAEDDEYDYYSCGVRRVCFEPGLEVIKPGMLADNPGLTSVTIPASVKEVQAWAFGSCTNLKNLVIEGDLSRVADWAQDAFEGWEGLAEAEGVPGEWLVIRNPFSGDTKTISLLKRDGILTLTGDAGQVEAVPLTIGKENAENSWLVTYRVLKYREGVKLQYQGRELDGSVIEDFLFDEYGISATARVEPFGDYTSVPGKAHPAGDSAEQATVINRDPEPKNTISGFVWWDTSKGREKITDYVDLHIKKNGTEIEESPIRLNKNDYPADEDTWDWELTVKDYDPDAEYTASEVIPDGQDGPDWTVETDAFFSGGAKAVSPKTLSTSRRTPILSTGTQSSTPYGRNRQR